MRCFLEIKFPEIRLIPLEHVTQVITTRWKKTTGRTVSLETPPLNDNDDYNFQELFNIYN